MKKLLPIFCLTIFSVTTSWSQCVFSCYNYSMNPITYSLYPTGGTNVINQFLPTIDDGITSPLPIGFNFTYYCATYSNVLICSNGFLQFDIGSPPNLSFSNPAQNFPDPASPNGIVAFNMSDFDPNVGGAITYTTIGTQPNRRFVLTYSNVPMWSCSTIVNSGQIILFETSNIIEIHTEQVVDPNNPSLIPCYPGTQGIENPTGSMGLSTPGRANANWTATTTSAYQFSPVATYTPAPPSTTITGSTTLCQGDAAFYSINSSSTALSYVWNMPGGWTGTSTLTSISATAGVSGPISVASVYTCGTSAPTTISVTVVPRPNVVISAVNPAIFCSGKTVTISTSGAASYTLQPGLQIGTPPFFDSPPASVVYSVTGSNTFGCVSANTATYGVTVKPTPTVTVNNGTLCLGETFTMVPSGATSYVYSSNFSTVKPQTSGVFTNTVTGTTNGCTGVPAVSSLTVVPLPTISIVATRTAICNKETTTLTASGAASVSWNSTLTAMQYTVKPSVTTVYTATGTSVEGCVSTGTVSVKVSPCNSIDESGFTSTPLKVFPNPSSGVFYFNLEYPSTVIIHDVAGRKISEQTLNAGENKINLENEPAGQYLLSIWDGINKQNAVLLKRE